MHALALVPRSALAEACASCFCRRCALVDSGGPGRPSASALLWGPDATCIVCVSMKVLVPTGYE